MFRLKPARHADMVWVVVRHNHLGDRPPLQRPGHERFPDRHAPFRVKARVDDRPSIPIVQRVDVDMVQLHRKRQAHP